MDFTKDGPPAEQKGRDKLKNDMDELRQMIEELKAAIKRVENE